MEHIGQRIKDLRKKADLTQDRLADYLGVSPQAVSKWEVGSASPDLALIASLCRVLGCSADELLGIDLTEDEEGAEELSRELTRLEPDDFERFGEIVTLAAQKYPRNEQISYRIAEAEYWKLGGMTGESEEERRRKEDAEKRLLAILADGKNETWKTYAASQLFQIRMKDGLREEAKIFAEQSGPFRDENLLACLDGEDWQNEQQFLVYKSLNWLRNYLDMRGDREHHLPSYEAAEAVVKAIVKDGNYVGYARDLSVSAVNQARLLIEAGEYGRAVEKLRDQVEYDEQWYRIVRAAAEDPGRYLPYTAPVLDSWGEGAGDLIDREDAVLLVDRNWRKERADFLKSAPIYAPLREREDFEALIAELESQAVSEKEETV
ncbi:MAG: helix-turn-helix transcriptional regulator [Clostridia bacterium]|nr:helix-turn-helix transcriptional regulator [Clostridia bacterium]